MAKKKPRRGKKKTRGRSKARYRTARRPRAKARAKAPARRRRSVRRNPKGPLQTPAVKYAAAAGVGAGVGLAMDRSGVFAGAVDSRLVRSLLYGLIIGAAGHFFLKGKRRQLAYAAGVGALIPGASVAIADNLAPLLSRGQSAATELTDTATARLVAGPTAAQRAVINNARAKSARGILN